MFGGLALWIGVTLMVVTLLFWLREGMRDYEHNEPQQLLPAVVHTGPRRASTCRARRSGRSSAPSARQRCSGAW